ncbi:endo alpha-1,4 polygalactosaminidase [Chondromyces apiculatus DSM 436]|uniref:Endo alpha-1,4 polygalactosaminidase n=2 Tax=Chondromyces apiculatus TaxID=51 RepID=A0A017T163_9BACT|nr:endo alpha-1,4 polygalactosaminidase [Chondromyces apiculatus DSM 436]
MFRSGVPLALSFLLFACSMTACGDDDADGSDGGGGSGAAGEGGSGAAGGGGSGASGGGGEGGSGGSGGGNGGSGGVLQLQPGVDWQWQLSDPPIDTSFDVPVYDIDLFTTEDEEIGALHAAGRSVICYFSAGSFEDYRPDSADFPDSVKGSPLDPPFQDELWIDIRTPEVRAIMQARIEYAVQRGCDGVEPDNVDGYTNDNGLGLTADDQLDFNRFIATTAHERGLSVGLKNDLEQLADLVDDFDWALNEECFTYDECDLYADTFIAAGKAVLHAEYVDESELDAVCAVTQPLGLSTLIKHIELDAYRVTCP